MIPAELDEHKYTMMGFSLRQSFEVDMPRPTAISTSISNTGKLVYWQIDWNNYLLKEKNLNVAR